MDNRREKGRLPAPPPHPALAERSVQWALGVEYNEDSLSAAWGKPWTLLLQPHRRILVHGCVKRGCCGSSQGTGRARPVAGVLPQLQSVLVRGTQVRVCVWNLESYAEQLSLPREGSDGKKPTQSPACRDKKS